jgi:hypothetical protein
MTDYEKPLLEDMTDTVVLYVLCAILIMVVM